MGERLYGRTGHPNLALSRVHLGTALAELGPLRRGLRAVQGRRRLLPQTLPRGPPARRRPGPAPGRSVPPARGPRPRRGTLPGGPGTRPAALRQSTRNVADAEAFALGRQRQLSYHFYLSASRDLPAAEQGRAYVGVWHAKGAVTRLLAERRAVRRLRLGQAEPGAMDGLPPARRPS